VSAGAGAHEDLADAPRLFTARGLRLGAPLSVAFETGSTNDDAKEGARAGAPHGAVWVAEAQTRGRGRQGRAWQSPPGENLLFSVLLRVACPPSRVPQLSLACGLAVRDAVARAIEDDVDVLVKWPNDVLVRRREEGRTVLRKVAGILVESSVSAGGATLPRTSHLVVGVGLNVRTRAFPSELPLATSIAIERAARGREAEVSRAAVLADVLAGLDADVELVAHRGLGLARVRARLAAHDALAGREVEVEGARGTAEGIDDEGRLLVRTASGETVRVTSGEVHLGLAALAGAAILPSC
jgi:BirA family biotin operon repressor/biotin-[acetyl-CoA-carboxylase] ligase